MKKALFSLLAASLVLVSWSPAMAAQETCLDEAPTGLECTVTVEAVDFVWVGVEGADKYSVDVEITDPEGVAFEKSFSAHEMTLSVPFTYFTSCGTASAKVKGLAHPKTKKCSQNNPWSDPPCTFEIPCPELP